MADTQTQNRTQDPDGPTDLPKESWMAVLKRTIKEFKQDNLTDWAAALTYYGVLSIFPMLLALVSILGLIGKSATQPLIDNLGTVAPGPAKTIFTSAIHNLEKSQGAAGIMSSSASRWRCGRPPATSRRSCARRTRSTTWRRGARSGRPPRLASASRS